jgi:hypothetical protein
MKYTEINKLNYEEACEHWEWLLRHNPTKEEEKEMEYLSILLNSYEVDFLYGEENA